MPQLSPCSQLRSHSHLRPRRYFASHRREHLVLITAQSNTGKSTAGQECRLYRVAQLCMFQAKSTSIRLQHHPFLPMFFLQAEDMHPLRCGQLPRGHITSTNRAPPSVLIVARLATDRSTASQDYRLFIRAVQQHRCTFYPKLTANQPYHHLGMHKTTACRNIT